LERPNQHSLNYRDRDMFKITHDIVAAGLSVLSVNSFALTNQNHTQIGRYTTVDNKPSAAQVNPLLAVGQYKFSSGIRTVGDAVKQVLSTTGYRLAEKHKINTDAASVLKLPLPLVDRQLGPLSVKTTINVLMGEEVFDLHIDPLHRVINFRVKPNMTKLMRAHHA
jgi:conjugative transfer region protein (TIGR03748 family)